MNLKVGKEGEISTMSTWSCLTKLYNHRRRKQYQRLCEMSSTRNWNHAQLHFQLNPVIFLIINLLSSFLHSVYLLPHTNSTGMQSALSAAARSFESVFVSFSLINSSFVVVLRCCKFFILFFLSFFPFFSLFLLPFEHARRLLLITSVS